MPRPNPQRRNVGNLGDILKHAALVELASALARVSPTVQYVDTHTFLLHAPPADVERWSREVDALASAHPAYGSYAALEREALARSGRHRCSSGLMIDVLGERRGSMALGEADAATRAELRDQIEQEQVSNVVVVDDAVAALRGRRDGAAGTVLVHVDPFTLSPELWARLAPGLDEVCGGSAEAVVVAYRYTRHVGSAWPHPPRGTSGPVARCQRNPHEVAAYASAGIADVVRDICAALGWNVAPR